MAGKLLLICCALAALVYLGDGCNRAGSTSSKKRSWPETVGMTGEEAKAIIEKDNPSLLVQIVPYGYAVTADYRTDRVRIYLDAEGIVADPPRIG